MIDVVKADAGSLLAAATRLRHGGLVAFPTETVYGLGADALNTAAVAQVFSLKGRPTDHPLIVHLASAAELWGWADREAQERSGVPAAKVEELARSLWPGPLTLVLHAGPTVPRSVTGGQDTVALRVPGNDTALRLLEAFGGGVVAPSANRFGRVSPTTAAHVATEFAGGNSPLLVLDDGPTRLGLESTVVDLTTGTARLLRPGSLSVAAIESVLGAAVVRPALEGADKPGSPQHEEGGSGSQAPRAPGTLAKHYAPATPLQLAPPSRLAARAPDEAVVARASEPSNTADDGRRAPWLVLPTDPVGFGRELYAAIRRLDEVGAARILVEEPPTGEAWAAVRDRLERAAAAHAAAGTSR